MEFCKRKRKLERNSYTYIVKRVSKDNSIVMPIFSGLLKFITSAIRIYKTVIKKFNELKNVYKIQ